MAAGLQSIRVDFSPVLVSVYNVPVDSTCRVGVCLQAV